MSRASAPAWPGYAPWAPVVRACVTEFTAVARSFWLIPELIPPVAREDVALLYCFCRRLDDAIDESADRESGAEALARVRAELGGQAEPRPLIAAFLAGAARSGLPLSCAEYLLDGMAGDLGPVRLSDDDDLLRYSYRVSSAVGLMLAPLLGIRDPEALPRIVDLGLGLQISNILLGVTTDAGRDRVYIPATRLARAGLTPDDVLRATAGSGLGEVLCGLADLADEFYASAELGAPLVPLRYRHGVLLLGRVYGELGHRAARGTTFRHPAELPPTARIRHLARLLLFVATPTIRGRDRRRGRSPLSHPALLGWPGTGTRSPSASSDGCQAVP